MTGPAQPGPPQPGPAQPNPEQPGGAQPSAAAPGPARDELEDLDPGLARERTTLAWTRTAISFAAVGGVVLKKDIAPGLVIMATALVIWRLGRLDHHQPDRLKLVAAAIVAVALVALIVALTSG